MKILVCGGREFTNYKFLAERLDRYKANVTHIIHGGARGADSLAGKWVFENSSLCVQEVICPANWNNGRGAGPERNRAMADLNPDLVIAFPGGAGTKSMVRIAKERQIKLEDYSDEQ
jgi:hypothetical protein